MATSEATTSVVKDATGAVVPSPVLTYDTDDHDVAIVDAMGNVSEVAPGTCNLIVTDAVLGVSTSVPITVTGAASGGGGGGGTGGGTTGQMVVIPPGAYMYTAGVGVPALAAALPTVDYRFRVPTAPVTGTGTQGILTITNTGRTKWTIDIAQVIVSGAAQYWGAFNSATPVLMFTVSSGGIPSGLSGLILHTWHDSTTGAGCQLLDDTGAVYFSWSAANGTAGCGTGDTDASCNIVAIGLSVSSGTAYPIGGLAVEVDGAELLSVICSTPAAVPSVQDTGYIAIWPFDSGTLNEVNLGAGFTMVGGAATYVSGGLWIGGEQGSAPGSISASPANVVLTTVGAQQALLVTVLSNAGAVIDGPALIYTSSNPTNFSVTAAGVITALVLNESGTVTITVSGTSVTTTVSVDTHATPYIKSATLTPANPRITIGNTGLTMLAQSFDQSGNPIADTWSYASGTTGVGTIDSSTGAFTPVAAGTTVITASDGGTLTDLTTTVTVVAAATGLVIALHTDATRNGVPLATQVGYHQTVHSKLQRSLCPLANSYNGPGSYDLSGITAMAGAFSGAGIDSIICFPTSCPGSINGDDSNEWLIPPFQSAAWNTWVTQSAGFAAAVATALYGIVDKFEIGNEEDQHFFYQQPSYPNVTAFGVWFQAVYTAIKAANPGATCVIGGLVGLTAGPTSDYTGETFLQDLYDAGIYGDGVAIHPYTDYPPSTTGILFVNLFSDIATIHSIMSSAGQGSAALWITEFGYPGTVDATCATDLASAVSLLLSTYTYVSIFCWFLMQDTSDYPTSGCFDTGGSITDTGSAFESAAVANGQ